MEKAIDDLDFGANSSLSKRTVESYLVPQISNECVGDILKGKVSIRVPRVIKGPKTKRAIDPLEKNKGKYKKTTNKKGVC